MSFPSQPDQLSRDWLSDTLGHPVSDFRVELFGEGTGVIGQVTRVHLRGHPDLPASIIAKFPSPAPENRAVAATYNMYGREVNFYQDLASSIEVRAPACHHAEFDADSQAFVLLLEDLQDMRIGDQVAGCTLEEAHLVVAGIATLHASTWRTQADVTSHNNPAQRDGMIAGFKMGWPVVKAEFADLIPASCLRAGDAMPGQIGRLLEAMTQDPVCIVHADVRLDNVFFGTDSIALVDWQSVCTSAPEQDLAYFVTQSLAADVRNARDWVAVYHDCLQAAGVGDYSLDACRHRYRISALYLLSYAVVIAGTLDLGNERGKALGRTLTGNAMQSLVEMNAFELLES